MQIYCFSSILRKTESKKLINPKKLQLQNCKKNCIISVVELFKKFLKVDKNENGKSTNSAVKQSLNL